MINSEKIWYELAKGLEDQLREEQRARRIYMWLFRGSLVAGLVAWRFL